MRKVVLAMMTTLNGRLDDPDVWLGNVGDDLLSDIDRAFGTFDTILVGRTTYDEMVAYWPGAETEEEASDANRSMARKMNSYKKLVFTRGSATQALEWNNAELVSAPGDDDLITVIDQLKGQSGGDIHLSGGAQLALSMIRLGLVDEYRFFVHPVVSTGTGWFDQINEERRDLKLLSTTTYDHGVVGLTYSPL